MGDTPPGRPRRILLRIALLIGGFLLANSILFRHPRTLVQEHFGGGRSRLASIREYIFHRVQVTLGFFYMLGGFCLQLWGQYATPPPGEPVFPTLWVGLVLLSALALEVLGWWLSHALFRHYVRGFLMRNPVDFVTEVRLAREVGELLGLETKSDETVQSYVARLRGKLGYQPIGFELLPQKFTLSRLQHLYEVVLERELDKRNFRRKVLATGLLVETREVEQDVAHRAARLCRFDERKYRQLAREGFHFEI